MMPFPVRQIIFETLGKLTIDKLNSLGESEKDSVLLLKNSLHLFSSYFK